MVCVRKCSLGAPKPFRVTLCFLAPPAGALSGHLHAPEHYRTAIKGQSCVCVSTPLVPFCRRVRKNYRVSLHKPKSNKVSFIAPFVSVSLKEGKPKHVRGGREKMHTFPLELSVREVKEICIAFWIKEAKGCSRGISVSLERGADNKLEPVMSGLLVQDLSFLPDVFAMGSYEFITTFWKFRGQGSGNLYMQMTITDTNTAFIWVVLCAGPWKTYLMFWCTPQNKAQQYQHWRSCTSCPTTFIWTCQPRNKLEEFAFKVTCKIITIITRDCQKSPNSWGKARVSPDNDVNVAHILASRIWILRIINVLSSWVKGVEQRHCTA